jgi:hypothetical protein
LTYPYPAPPAAAAPSQDGASDVAAAAREYAAWGWSYIPIHPPVPGDAYRDGKRPATGDAGWLAYSQRRPTDDEREFWFPPSADGNIGIICGQVSDGLLVIDCDDMATYAALCYLYPELRTSRTVRTGKGMHIYCYAGEPVKTTKFQLFGSTHHIKAEGSYVVAPPSLHASGRRYEWLADVPPLALDLPRLRTALAALAPARAEHEPNHDRGWAAQLLREGAKHGERDDLTFKLAAYLIHYLPYDTALAVLELWADARCAQTPDPWGPGDVEAKLQSAARYEGAPLSAPSPSP